jgi:hypothetical protein
MEGEEVLMMYGKAADFNRDMYQVNIASMDVLMQLVQVVDSMREGQGVIMDALERVSDDGGGSQGELMAARQASAETEALATELSKKLRVLVQRVDRMNARYGAYLV